MAELNWRNAVTDERERKVFEGLEDPRWDWRTLRALSQASGLETEKVLGIIAKYPHLVRKSAVPSQKGEDLYTLQNRYYKSKKAWDYLSSFST